MAYFIAKAKIAVSKPVFSVLHKPTPCTYIGAGTIHKAAEILRMSHAKKILLVTDSFLHKNGLLDGLLQDLRDHAIEAIIYDGVTPDPTFTVVEEGLRLCESCEAVVAVGGGSVLDTAKAVAAAYTNQKKPQELAGLLRVKKPILPFIAVPTTAGTGSETTIVAVVSDPRTHQKCTIIDPKLVPMFAILDPELTIGLPRSATVFTAMDALTHALEAYISTYATVQTDRYAEMAIQLIYEYLPKVYENLADVQAREKLLTASFLAGLAFTRTYVGYAHAFAHNIGAKYGVPHGLANAVLLPWVMEFSMPNCKERFARLSNIAGLSQAGDIDAKSDRFLQSIFAMGKAMDVPERLEKFDPSGVESVLEAGFHECHGTYPVPRYMNKEQARELLRKVCANGKGV